MSNIRTPVRDLSVSDPVLTLAQIDLAAYTVAHFPAFQLPPFLEVVASRLEAVARGEVKRLILNLPPRHGKSLLASVFLPSWFLGRNPHRNVIACSYGSELADDFGRRVRNLIASPLHRAIFPASRLAEDSRAVSRFNLVGGGSYVATGAGGPITGRGADLLLIDDPTKNSEEASSQPSADCGSGSGRPP